MSAFFETIGIIAFDIAAFPLLSTGDAKLVEHTGHDDYWGDGGDGSGRNMLGQLLMELRRRLRDQ